MLKCTENEMCTSFQAGYAEDAQNINIRTRPYVSCTFLWFVVCIVNRRMQRLELDLIPEDGRQGRNM
jgi:hypothetical protein